MEIQHEDNGTKGRFYIMQGNKCVGEMTYVWSGDQKIIADHTEVGDELKGKGAGKLLLDQLVTFARKNKLRIMPLCPFVKAQFEKSNAFDDVKF